jgi:alanine racemase
MRSTIAVIDKRNIRNNLKVIRQNIQRADILAIVKANAYGHGMTEVAATLRDEKVKYLGVAFVDEGIQLREAGDTGNILVLVPELHQEANWVVEYDLEVAVSQLNYVKALSEEALTKDKTVNVHIYVDTGMNRDGIKPGDTLDFVTKVSKLENLNIKGICTHFATSPSDREFALQQLNQFREVIEELKNNGFEFEFIHASNSGGILNIPEAEFNLVRPGLALYGYSPNKGNEKGEKLKPVMTLKSKVISIRRIQAGESVNYDRTFVADKATSIATIPIGYGDGYFKALSNKGECLINGKRYPIVGTVCMDECSVDVGNDNVYISNEAVLIGEQGDSKIMADEIARKIGTITYEVTSQVTMRVPRIYIDK